MNFKTILTAVVNDAGFVGEEAIKTGKDLLEFAGLITPALLPVATDMLTDIAQHGATPAQVSQQIVDATAVLGTAQAAIAVIKAQDVAPVAQPAAAEQEVATAAE